MLEHPFRRRRKGISPMLWTRWQLDWILRRHPMPLARVAAEAGLPRRALYDWMAGRRSFGRRRLARLTRWCRPRLTDSSLIAPEAKSDTSAHARSQDVERDVVAGVAEEIEQDADSGWAAG